MERVRHRLRRLASRARRAWEAEVRARARRRPIWSNTILYESFGGNGALDNPEAIFRRLLTRPEARGIRHVWVLGPGHRAFRTEFRRRRDVRIVRYRSGAYIRALARARYLVNNATFAVEWGKRSGQVYLNTWHGTPLKLMGYDMPGGALQSANVLRNLLMADVVLSQSSWMTERMYLGAYRLEGIFRGRIVEVGYPRVDRQHLDERERAAIRDQLGAGTRRLLVFAPTWTGVDFAHPRDEAVEQLAVVRDLQSRLGDDWTVLLKAHQSVHALLKAHPAASEVLIDNDIPTNRVLGVADHLITDFSSIFFDYLAMDRPITFFVPASSPYRDERGAYFADDELPGPVLGDLDSVAARISDPADPFRRRRRAWARRFLPYDDGAASDRAIDALLHPAVPAPPPSTRRSLLVYVGGMRSNGITSSALNLLRALDHDEWDVTAFLARPRGTQRANQTLIDPRVRQIIRAGGMNGTKAAVLRLQLRQRLAPRSREPRGESVIWRDEWHRLFGDAQFDVVADFSGYSRFWTQILLHSPTARRLVWLHNDMAAEVHRTGAGRTRAHPALRGVLWLLRRFDAAVSVSPRLSTLNRDNLSVYGMPPERFVSVRNLIDADRVHRGARVPLTELPELTAPIDAEGLPVDPDWSMPAWVAELAASSDTWFVTVGRLSPEKNHARLIDALEQTRRQTPRTRLLIVGDGPLRSRLEADIRSRGLEHAIVFAGSFANPFPLMAAADCFVLSSDYEGQPMVMLEAATLGLPIITTDFASSSDALPEGCARVVPLTAEGLAAAMLEFADRPWVPAPFDAESYNGECVRDADDALRGEWSESSRSASSSSISPTSPKIFTAAHDTATRSAATATRIHHMTSSDSHDVVDHPAPHRPRDV